MQNEAIIIRWQELYEKVVAKKSLALLWSLHKTIISSTNNRGILSFCIVISPEKRTDEDKGTAVFTSYLGQIGQRIFILI